MIKLALRSALSDRHAEGKVVVLDELDWSTPSTKAGTALLSALGIDSKVLLVVDRDDAVTALSFRNLPQVQLIQPGELNAYDVLCNEWIVFTAGTVPSSAAANEKEAV
jgi:large subunit ribosomal protein L4